ncbi:chromosome loss-related protein [Rhizina undulata]
MPKRKYTSNSLPKGALPNAQLIAHSPQTRRLLTRLSKDSLLDLVLDSWLDPGKIDVWAPELRDEDADDEDPGLTVEQIREIYEGYRKARGVRTKDVAERIVEKEWRKGLKVGMIAECDVRYLLDHPSTYKWTAALLHPLSETPNTSTPLPLHFSTVLFTHTLTSLLSPLLSLHYHSVSHPTLPLSLLRLQLHDQTTRPTPATPLQLPIPKRIFYLAFPHSSHHIFLTLSAGTDGLRDIVRQSIATAISREHARFTLKSTNLSSKTLEALVHFRGAEPGAGDGRMAAGGWSIYTSNSVDPNPLAPHRRVTSAPEPVSETPEEEVKRKRMKTAEGRFGSSAKMGDGKGLESVEFRLEEVFAEKGKGKGKGKGKEGGGERDGEGGGERDGEEEETEEEFRPVVTVKFDGAHVFAGIRTMVEEGVGFDPRKMPGWVTGEDGVNVGVVREGKVLRKKRI